jgi:SAM-dependent methyltransferase
MSTPIVFADAEGYEPYMGRWSQLVGDAFLDWLAPAPALRWLDVGCGNGAFTERIVERCAPAAVTGVDPSRAQLDFARRRLEARGARFQEGDAMALPFADGAFDSAVMPLVIFFVPEPARGVAEMARVLAPGGVASAYAWDMEGGGFPYEAVRSELTALGAEAPSAPSIEASRLDVLQELWSGAGLVALESRAFAVARTFADFAEYWTTIQRGPSLAARLAALSGRDRAHLESALRARLAADSAGRITVHARANAIRGKRRA